MGVRVLETFIRAERPKMNKVQLEKEKTKKKKGNKAMLEDILETQQLILELLTGQKIE